MLYLRVYERGLHAANFVAFWKAGGDVRAKTKGVKQGSIVCSSQQTPQRAYINDLLAPSSPAHPAAGTGGVGGKRYLASLLG